MNHKKQRGQKKWHSTKNIATKTILNAVAGEPMALMEIVKAYEPYINKLSQRTYIDGKGRKRQEVDGFVKKTLETSLIAAIMKFDPYRI